MPVIVHKGDLFHQARSKNLAHGVNCAGVMGAGIATEFKRQFPDMFDRYNSLCRDGRIIPGQCWPWREVEITMGFNSSNRIEEVEEGIYIYNLAIKSHWKLSATYEALKSSLDNMVSHMEKNNIVDVSMPWVGCGLGGLEQNKVKKIMNKSIKDKKIIFHVFER